MKTTTNMTGHVNVELTADENHSMVQIPEGFEIADITILYTKPGTEECFTIKQETKI